MSVDDDLRRVTAKLSILFSRGSLTSTSRRAIALQPPLNEERVAAYEREQGIVLPADYRAFITRVFGCGNWPFYGCANSASRIGRTTSKISSRARPSPTPSPVP